LTLSRSDPAGEVLAVIIGAIPTVRFTVALRFSQGWLAGAVLAVMTDQQRRDLLEVLDDRCGRAATLVTSQYPVAEWHGLIGEATIADASWTG